MTVNIANEILDAIRAEATPDGLTSASGVGPGGGRVKHTDDETRGHIARWLGALRAIEQIKRTNHPNQVRVKAREVTESLLDSLGA